MDDELEPIAVIGMAGRFPGADDVEQLWHNLSAGRESVRFLSEDELLAAGVPRSTLDDPTYVRAVAEAAHLDMFDAALFGMSAREARTSDPQLRLFLETAHAAVENAGYDPDSVTDVGVFGAAGTNRYVDLYLRPDPAAATGITGLAVGTWNNLGSLATMVSYKLDFTGPAMSVQTACSSSLVAIHQAVSAIRNGECELALAGGVEVELPLTHGHRWAMDGPFSRDGHCRPFDAAASGTIFGSGVGVVVLKKLARALDDGDAVRAVVRATAVNNDGARKVGFTAPGVTGQTNVVLEAMMMAEADVRHVGLIEAHATGTMLGDPIEVAALLAAYRRLGHPGDGTVALSSVKANVGHLGHAAGVTSFIRAVLSLERERIAPTINVSAVNPKLELDGSPFHLPSEPTPWPRRPDQPRLAAVSSLGIGGTNAHAVLQEAPLRVAEPAVTRPRLLVWSAATTAARDTYQERIRTHLADQGEQTFTATVSTLQHGRRAYPHRAALVAESAAEAVTGLSPDAANAIIRGTGDRRELAFLFPGQGAQHAGMVQDLYQQEPHFAEALDETLHLFSAAGADVAQTWRTGDDTRLASTAVAQPLLFAVEYALARLWRSWGVVPHRLLGHSVGELTAAAVAEVVSLSDAVTLVAARARAMERMPAGGMLAVAATADELADLLSARIGIAAVNGPRQTVLAGPHDALAELAAPLRERGLRSRPIRTAHAFHTEAMRAAADEFRAAFGDVTLRPPRIPIVSAATGATMTARQATDPTFWADQLVEPVLFGPALEHLLGQGPQLLIEVGPGQTLTSLSRSHRALAEGGHTAVASLPARRPNPGEDQIAVLRSLAAVWTDGHDVDWHAVGQGRQVIRTPLPAYPYQRERFWADPPAAAPISPTPEAPPTERAEAAPPTVDPTEEQLTADTPVDQSPFSVPCWVQAPRRADRGHDAAPHALLLAEEDRARDLTVALQRAGIRVVPVPADRGSGSAERSFHLPVRRRSELADLLRDVAAAGRRPLMLVHAWGLSDEVADRADPAALQRPFRDLHEVARLVSRTPGVAEGTRIVVLTRQAVDISGAEGVRPEHALLPPLVRTIADEDRRLTVRLIDLGGRVTDDDLAGELADQDGSPVVALRGDLRWVPAERRLEVVAGAAPTIRRNGVYLITGGGGGLGIEVARGLARTGQQPILVLVGRTGSVPDDVVDELGALGATVRAHGCDITDTAALGRLVDEVTQRWGPVNGVLHLAGRIGSGTIQFTGAADSEATFAPKMAGALSIETVFAGRQRLDFLVCFSSRAALEGQVGGADYAAANAYLDTFVRDTPLAADRLLSIDWPAWHGVGMAAGGMLRSAGRAPARRWQTVLSAENDPVTDEHRLGTVPVVPGTRHLDLVVEAFRAEILDGAEEPVRLTDVVFQRMLELTSPRRVEVAFNPEGESWAFSVSSAPPTTSSPTDVQTHVRGRIAAWRPDPDATAPRRVDLPALRATLTEHRPLPPFGSDRQAFTLGPRWRTYHQVQADPAGDNQLLILALPEDYQDEARRHAVHPTLMDAATTSVRDLDRDDIHVPFMYRSAVVHGRLPGRILSHIRRRPDAPANSIVADLDVLDEDGTVLVEVRGFTMRRAVDPAALVSPRGTDETAESVGIPPEVGVDLLMALLTARTPRQVAVLRFRGGRPEPSSSDAGTTQVRQVAPAPRPVSVPRPPVSANGRHEPSTMAAPAVPVPPPMPTADPTPAPGTVELADQVRELWTAATGVADLSDDQDFFALGGDSLIAVELMSQVRDRFGVDLSIGAIFDYSTLGSFTEELRRLGAGR
ncbi:SDR family NAD(P)-dependent oxidoreductase [Micromonospora orduensis]|uniref:SDR family NAD(P)-dependent oxidoreductase n=1 Tax=Micromonospora orduensis TaxID=1420891 RepID=A0A5C4QLM4_9ACTN|nr:type I polyketide synthase [Micromonospora orduensis]TNH27982.1 SDR family NAD(P)-dependent oxidoreductase [Micromonospora orduensis]